MVTIYNTTLSATSQRHFSDGLGGVVLYTDYPVRVTFFNIIRLITRNSQLWNPALLCLYPADNHIFNNISVQL